MKLTLIVIAQFAQLHQNPAFIKIPILWLALDKPYKTGPLIEKIGKYTLSMAIEMKCP